MQVPFPAAGRRILGRNFARFLDYDLCELVYKTVCFGEDDGPDLDDLTGHMHTLKTMWRCKRFLVSAGGWPSLPTGRYWLVPPESVIYR